MTREEYESGSKGRDTCSKSYNVMRDEDEEEKGTRQYVAANEAEESHRETKKKGGPGKCHALNDEKEARENEK